MTKTVAVIVNPTSGRGKGGKAAPEVAAGLHRRGIDSVLLVTVSAAETLKLARAAVDDGVDALVAAGGDGTVNLAVQALAGSDTPLGIVPLGTGNDNADLIGLDGDLESALDTIADFDVRSIDVGQVRTSDGTDRWFMGVLSSGFDSCATERANNMRWPKGDLRYLFAIVAELSTFKPVPYLIDIDGLEIRSRGMLVAVGNGRSYGAGMKVCGGAEPDDGVFDLTFLKAVGKIEFLRTFPKVYKGTHFDHDEVEQYQGKKVRLEAPGQIVYADGERIGPLPADIEILAGGLRVLVPRGSELGAAYAR
jgi:diacylglycerol kinase (ATP)